ncbi:MAG: hypothetical protein NTW19_23405 [Planctomycetota bacterium]|nr:hypothetical protein [Planctomycetota bacterium]
MRYTIEDLGVGARGDLWANWRHARHPKTGEEFALGALTRGGFVLINPATKSAAQVRPPRPTFSGEGVAQAPLSGGLGGTIYQCDYGPPNPRPYLMAWDWDGQVSRAVMDVPVSSVMTIDAGIDGGVYLPDYSENTMFRVDPRVDSKGPGFKTFTDFKPFGQYIRNVFCGLDRLVYVTSNTYGSDEGITTVVAALDPATGRTFAVEAGALKGSVAWGGLTKDAVGRVLVPTYHWGRPIWHEVVDGKLRDVDQKSLRLAAGGSPLTFDDGSAISAVKLKEVTFLDPAGKSSTFTIEREESPLRLFSVASGGGKIWNGTFMPLQLSSYDPGTREVVDFGNPSQTEGEPYTMAFVRGKLYLACYCNAHVVRYDPARPIRRDASIHANPAHLGRVKEEGLPLQRPVGVAVDTQERVFFAAMGGYGCLDSGMVRIDARTDELVRWLYPNTTVGAITFHKASGLILFSERREGEEGIRFTLLSPEDGSTVWSEIVLHDGGAIHSLLDGGDGLVYGLHAHRAALFAFDVKARKIVASLPELGVGHHCHNALVDGPDGRIWGVTTDAVYAVDRGLKKVEVLGNYAKGTGYDSHRFGACFGEDGHLYFHHGNNIMRLRVER